MSIVKDYLNSVTKAINDLDENAILDVANMLKQAYIDGRQVFLMGNGGSASTASHMACDLQKGVKTHTGKRFKVCTVSDNIPLMTAWANDTDYENIFAEQLDSLLNPNDVVVALSGSGNSLNIIKAVKKANEIGAITIGWSGFGGGKLAEIVDKPIVVNSSNMQKVEDVHMILAHIMFAFLVNNV